MKYIYHLIFILFIFLNGCSKAQMYNWVKEWQQSHAKLSLNKLKLSIGEVVYLDGKDRKKSQEVILMIHGFGASKETFVPLASEMREDYRAIIPDVPGHGESVQSKNLTYSIQNQIEWLDEFIKKLKIMDKFHIMGNSMGGAISIRYTYLYPEKIKSLTLIDSAGAVVTKSEFYYLLVSGKNSLIVNNSQDFERLLDFSMEKKPYIPGPILEVLSEQKMARKDLDAKIFQDMLADVDQMPILPEIKIPTLILWGKKDRVIHVDSAEYFHQKIEGSKKIIFENIGHVPMLEVPKETSEVCTKFLKGI
ncbi:MAG: alpha/beta hydrolase [Leptospiraceae bacterium]|nr:alpha/beta hydrolase [Leptospiraceae bacterium]